MFKLSMFGRGLVYGTVATMSANMAVWYLLSGQSRGVDSPGVRKVADEDPTSEDTRRLETLRSVLKYGEPDRGSHTRVYNGHVLSYDRGRRIPYWTAELITKDRLSGSANRKWSKFQADPDVKSAFTSANSDYLSSGWSRGHMTPAGDLKHDQRAMDHSFFLSNIVPQDFDNNSGFWNRFENFCRDLTKRYDEVRVITGPLFLAGTDEDGKRRLKHEVIGRNNVHVPTHLYKIIVAERYNDKTKSIGAFVVPNVKLGYKNPLKHYQVPVSELEAKVGVEFLPNLPHTHVMNLCSVESCKMVSRESFERVTWRRSLYGSRDAAQLENTWNEITEKKMNTDKTLEEAYNRRRLELHEQRRQEL